MRSSDDIRSTFIDFFRDRGHTEIASTSLVPDGDTSVLFTSAGMQPLIPCFSGAAHPAGRRLVNIQRCLRTVDIESVGDASHLTCFEMLGSWSLGDYFKRDALALSLELLTDGFGLDPERLCVTVFAGDDRVPFDRESYERWIELGFAPERIHRYGREENWWGPPGPHGPCGPDSEVFYWTGDGPPQGHPEADERWLEVWNNVFISFELTPSRDLRPLAQHNVDTGMGLERIAAVLQGGASVYDTDVFASIRDTVRGLERTHDERAERIVADHVRAGVMLVADGVVPSNARHGYVLRRLLWRAIRMGRRLGIEGPFVCDVAAAVVERFGAVHPHVAERRDRVMEVLDAEERRFGRTLRRGLGEIERLARRGVPVDGRVLFGLFETHGLPPELSVEELAGHGIRVEGWQGEFDAGRRAHRERSREAGRGATPSRSTGT
jgi:alanyl-tRNA synthetase